VARNARSEDRVEAEVPIRFNGTVAATTRDLSASGVYFVADKKMVLGQSIRFAIDIDGPMGPLCLWCAGKIVRIEDVAGKTGVAVSISESRLERR
jgi:hypothetical protein